MARAYIALGSNVSPRRFFIDSAVKNIGREQGTTVKKRSSVYDTFPVGGPPQPRYLNSVIEVETSLKPRELLSRLLRIEKSLHRVRRGRNRPRTIDLDVLLYDDLVIRDKRIGIPHPRMHKRDFVIFGINEISPTAKHPVLRKTVSSIYNHRPMKILRDPNKTYAHILSLKRKGKRIGFVPTMGCLHEGHISLIRKARRENDVVIVSIFVNPAQFAPGEDFKRYPRNMARDKAIAKKSGTDIIFNPREKDVYGRSYSTYVNVEGITENLCGSFRPGHFRGVSTIVAKMFNIIPADNAYFGQKDAQQALMIKRMARDLNVPVRIKILPTIRDKGGLAMSSRNTYLSQRQRREAESLFKSLMSAKEIIKKGERNAENVIESMRRFIKRKSPARIEYISIVDTGKLKDIKTLKGEFLIAIAAYFGKVRLIDNVIIKIGRR